jgi:hypothetical protein
MTAPLAFPPARQRGITIQTGLVLAFSAITAVAIWRASLTPIGPALAVYVLVAAVAFFPIPFLAYWLYALTRANYSLDRDKLVLSWGLRVEQIPISDVEWVRPVSGLPGAIPLPAVRLPGAVLGTRRHPDLGPVEFLASDVRSMLLVSTEKHIFAISPEDATGFMENIQHTIEMGSLTPAAAESIYLSFVVVQAWESLLARYLWLAGLFLNAGLLVWVSLTIPALGKVALGFLPSGLPGEGVPGVGLILLPILSIALFAAGWAAGLFFYRRQDQRVLAQIVWAGGVFTSLLFLVAAMFLLITPV